jgi:hypothetical protein
VVALTYPNLITRHSIVLHSSFRKGTEEWRMMSVEVGFAVFIDEPMADATSSFNTQMFVIRHSEKEPKNGE